MQKVTDALMSLRDEGTAYRDFVARSVPNIERETILGIRRPNLRAYAKAFGNDPDRLAFMRELPHVWHEENNLHAELLGSFGKDFDRTMAETERFLPYVDNWETCDATPKIFAKHPDEVYEHILVWLHSDHPYTVRFALVALINNYLEEHFRPEMPAMLAELPHDDYYVYMALAWYYSVALVKQYDSAIPIIEGNLLDAKLHNKAIQKAVESFRIPDETKRYLKSLRR